MDANRKLKIIYLTLGMFALVVARLDAANFAGSQVAGKIEAGAYRNPERTFSVRIPPLQQPGAVIRDRRLQSGGWLVEFTDNLCRSYAASEQTATLAGKAFSSWVLEEVIPQIEQSGGVLVSAKRATKDTHPAMLVRYREPKRAGCTVYRAAHATLVQPGGYSKDEEQRLVAQGFSIIHPDAQVGLYIFYADGRVYRLFYTVGENMLKQSTSPNVGPVDGNLGQFVKGFTLLR
jgi:hypothetical protein